MHATQTSAPGRFAKHLILFIHQGENSTTPHDPFQVWRGQVDLGTMVSRCFNSGDDRAVSINLYEVREVELPDWLAPEEWIRHEVSWRYAWAMGLEKSWPEAWQRGLLHMESASLLGCVNLLKVGTFRNPFRASLRAQLVAWMEDQMRPVLYHWERAAAYKSPFSRTQWGYVVDGRTVRAADRTSTSLYYSRRAAGTAVEVAA